MDQTHKPETFDDHEQWYGSSLKTVSQSADILYTYNTLIHGYSATLTAEEAESLEKQLGVLSVLPETVYQLHTTRSPLFLGLEQKAQQSDLLPASTSVSEVTVGVLDTGVWPELESFNDKGLGPVPTTWKGTCEVGKKFDSTKCNKKLIGARSPRDDDGHGSHTSTTAAGSVVSGANLFGFATGTARGMAPQARVAVYKVCWLGGCFGSDILAAMEKAVEDGVNVISMSIGGGLSDYYRDTVSIGAFSAAAQGIFVSCSAGNGGPSQGSLSNVAPWITTVGAGTLDRNFPAYVTLGNGNNFTGTSLYSGKPLPADTLIPLVYAANASDSVSGNLCQSDSLIRSKVSGKIVICDRGGNSRAQKGLEVQKSGGIGMILSNTELFGEELVADSHLIPSSAVGQKVGDAIKKYASSDPKPTATISSGGTHVGIEPSPVVAAFSSRGPNLVTPEILKPDVIAPGVNILAGWLANDTRSVSFNIISGTSMSCPHVSGLAALIKAAHQDWSPAAIRSALMTTAYTAYKTGGVIQDVSTGKPATPFDYGAGHVNPVAALDPGLVYDATVEDYFGFLCALNYTAELIKRATNKGFTCDSRKTYSLGDFNYPSFSVALQTASVKYSRTLTNVGSPGTYKVALASETKAVKMTVQPATLTFGQEKEKKSYTVTFTAASMPSGTTSFAHLEWSDGKHMVHSPIAFTWA
ncbi:Subtilisin-like protease SBT1.7 [Linum grandiflorum]